VKNELLTEKQLSEKSQKEMEEDLVKTKHRLVKSVEYKVSLFTDM
jgi:hypothetical protein